MNIKLGYGQFYDSPKGVRLLALDIKQMAYFPYRADLCQDEYTGELSWDLYIESHGVMHKVNIAYDMFHPDLWMKAVIEYPRLDRTKMAGHWLGDNSPCYTLSWSRKWTAVMVATQLTFWLDDYYKELNGISSRTFNPYTGPDDLGGLLRRFKF